MPSLANYRATIARLLRNQEGAAAIEYGLLASLIAVAAITSLESIGDNLATTFNKVGTSMQSANGSTSAPSNPGVAPASLPS